MDRWKEMCKDIAVMWSGPTSGPSISEACIINGIDLSMDFGMAYNLFYDKLPDYGGPSTSIIPNLANEYNGATITAYKRLPVLVEEMIFEEGMKATFFYIEINTRIYLEYKPMGPYYLALKIDSPNKSCVLFINLDTILPAVQKYDWFKACNDADDETDVILIPFAWQLSGVTYDTCDVIMDLDQYIERVDYDSGPPEVHLHIDDCPFDDIDCDECKFDGTRDCPLEVFYNDEKPDEGNNSDHG